MRYAFRLALFAAVLTLPFAVPASAQYMYMDSNGNGIHDSGDRLNANGDSTVVDIYLSTTQNKDGSPVTCNTLSTAVMDINSYAVNIVATGGTATYRNYINRQTTAFPNQAQTLNTGDGTFKTGFFSFTYTAGGLFRIGTLTITGTGGSPKIGFVDILPASQDFTSFGTPCPGIAGDNTYRLDGPNTRAFYGGPGDWSVAEGLDQAPGGNNPPVITNPGNRTVDELVNLALTVTATDPDAGQTVTFSLDAGAPTGATISAGGAFSWTPSEAQGPGVHPVTVTATDNGTPAPQSASTVFTITVNEVNVAPVLAAIGNQTVTVNNPLSFTATATDADIPANGKSFGLIGAPAGATISAATGIFSWTPAATGTFPVTVTVTDDGVPPLGDSEGITITVSPGANQPPVLAAIGNRTIAELASLAFTATGTDPDAGQTLTFSLDAGAPAGATIGSASGAFSWTPTEAQGPGSYPVTIRVTDNGTPSRDDFEAITITVTEVNVAPVLAAIGNKTGTVGTPVTFTATATDADLPANTLTFSLDAGGPAGAAINPTTGVFSWTPASGQIGANPLTVRVTDNGTPALDDFEAITIQVSPAPNVAPTLAAIGNKTVNENAILTFTATATDTDASQILTFSLDAGAPAGATINSTSGVFLWQPIESDGPGVFPITVRVTDNGTPALSDFELINVTVNEVNQAPVLNTIGNKTVNELTNLNFTATATDADLPANTLTFSLDVGAPSGALMNAGGVFSWTPTEAQGPGSYPVTIRVTDNGIPALNDFSAISITVNEVNTAPVLAGIGDKATTVGVAVTFTATATDADVPANTLAFSLDAGAPAGATISATTGAFSYTPSANGTFPVTVRVTDNGTPALSASEAISIVVSAAPNQPPVLGAIGNKTVNEETNLSFTATATDPDAGQTLTFSLDAGAPSGAAITAGGVFSWTPTEAQGPGSYPITVRVTDDGTPNLSDSEAITITVNEVNVAPVLAAIGNKAGTVGVAVAFTASATDADIPANALTFSLDAGAPAGATINGATGAFGWTPSATGSFAATVRVTDDGTPPLSDFEAITIDVTQAVVNHAPVLDPIGNKTVDEETLLSFTATASDPDAGQTLTFSLDAGAPSGAAITAGGVFSWTPAEVDGPGSFPVTVRVTDNGSPAMDDFEAITITVNEVNVAPVLAAIGNKGGVAGAQIAFKATATDADIPTNEMTFSLDAGAPAGAAIDPTTGDFTWTPPAGGTFTVVVRVTDNGTPPLSAFEEITIVVTEEVVNHPPVLDAIGNKTVDEETLLSFTATASDPDAGQALTFSLDAGAPSGAAITAGGVFSWTPNEAQGPGSYPSTIRVTDNGSPVLNDFETVTITVNEVNVAPVLAAIGNKTGTVGASIAFTASATDADIPVNTLTFSLDAGAPAGATIEASSGVFNWTPTGSGNFPVTVRVTDSGTPALSAFETIQIAVASPQTVASHAFFFGRNLITILGFGDRATCVQIEPVNNSYLNSNVDLTSIVMKYAGKEIHTGCGNGERDENDDDCAGARLDGDKNHNGIREIKACFSHDNLQFLFSDLPSGLSRVEVAIEGNLKTGGRFRDTVTHLVLVLRNRCNLAASPNPLNPETVLNFTTTQRGPVTVRVFDIAGRLVKTLQDGTMPAGFNSIRWDGSADNGARVATGVYFVKMISLDGEQRLRVTVLK